MFYTLFLKLHAASQTDDPFLPKILGHSLATLLFSASHNPFHISPGIRVRFASEMKRLRFHYPQCDSIQQSLRPNPPPSIVLFPLILPRPPRHLKPIRVRSPTDRRIARPADRIGPPPPILFPRRKPGFFGLLSYVDGSVGHLISGWAGERGLSMWGDVGSVLEKAEGGGGRGLVHTFETCRRSLGAKAAALRAVLLGTLRLRRRSLF